MCSLSILSYTSCQVGLDFVGNQIQQARGVTLSIFCILYTTYDLNLCALKSNWDWIIRNNFMAQFVCCVNICTWLIYIYWCLKSYDHVSWNSPRVSFILGRHDQVITMAWSCADWPYLTPKNKLAASGRMGIHHSAGMSFSIPSREWLFSSLAWESPTNIWMCYWTSIGPYSWIYYATQSNSPNVCSLA